MNTVVIVGVVKFMSDVKLTSNHNKVMNVTVEVERPFKNQQGFYDTDYVDVILWKGLAETAMNIGGEGKYICVKGRIQSRKYENEDKSLTKIHEVVADRIYFLS